MLICGRFESTSRGAIAARSHSILAACISVARPTFSPRCFARRASRLVRRSSLVKTGFVSIGESGIAQVFAHHCLICPTFFACVCYRRVVWTNNAQAKMVFASRAQRKTGIRRGLRGYAIGLCMPTKRKTSKTSKRTVIEPHKGDRRYVRRSKTGKFKKEVNVGRSLAADRRRKSTTKVKRGQGDRGDV